jgi:anti-sigma regulatory factor (Ser/Thr protein kinase)
MKVQFEADINILPKMIAYIRDQSQAFGFHPLVIHKIELACEEALVNIIKHGFPYEQGHISLDCHNCSTKTGFEIFIADNGIAFNPLEYLNSHPRQPQVDSNKIGGNGVYLLLNLMDKVEYKRNNNLNTLILVKYAVS